MNKNILDLKDRKILYELDINARRSNSQIAKKVGLSKEVVNYRIKRLTQQGIIKGFTTLIDTTKLGFLSFRVFLKFHNSTPAFEKKLKNYLSENVGWFVTIKGNWDLNFCVWTENIYEFMELWNDFFLRYNSHLERKWISIITRMWHYRRTYLLDDKSDRTDHSLSGPEYSLLGEKFAARAKTDKIDDKILEILARNARTSTVDIAAKLNISEKVVRYRIKKLINEKIIIGFRAFLDLEKLGYEYYKVHLELQNLTGEKKKNLLQYAYNHPNIIYCTEAINGADFELEIQVKSNKDLYKIIDQIKEKFYNIIKDYEFMQYIEEHKLVYLPVKH